MLEGPSGAGLAQAGGSPVLHSHCAGEKEHGTFRASQLMGS